MKISVHLEDSTIVDIEYSQHTTVNDILTELVRPNPTDEFLLGVHAWQSNRREDGSWIVGYSVSSHHSMISAYE